MADWQQYLQSVFFGIFFSFLLAKLFSIIFAFHDENLRVTRSHQTESESRPDKPRSSSTRVLEENEALVGHVGGNEGPVKESTLMSDHSDSDDDWEGVESTELDETFSAASVFVAATAAPQKVSNEVQLQLYGLYKIATEGPCSAPQPSPLKMTARAKWQAWQKLGALPPEEAMQKYIDIVTDLYPSWAYSSAIKKKNEESSDAYVAGYKGPMRPVFSTFTYEEEPDDNEGQSAVHYVRFVRVLPSPSY